jgi:hypothetical protein
VQYGPLASYYHLHDFIGDLFTLPIIQHLSENGAIVLQVANIKMVKGVLTTIFMLKLTSSGRQSCSNIVKWARKLS